MESIFYYPNGRYLLTETTITQQIFDTSIPMHFRIIQFAHAWSETELNIITENDELLRRRIKRQITFNYKTITAFRETGAHHLLLQADQAKILIHKQTDDYPKLYAILRQKIAVLQEAEQATFPWLLRIHDLWLFWIIRIGTITLFMGYFILFTTQFYPLLIIPLLFALAMIIDPTTRQKFTFTADTITCASPSSQKVWEVKDLQRAFLKTQQIKQTSKQIRLAILEFATGERFEINQHRAWGYGYSPERIVSILSRLFPHLSISEGQAEEKQPPTFQAQSFIELGHKYRRQSKLLEAIAAYEQAIHLAPGYDSYYFEIANLLYELGYHEQAVRAYRRGFKAVPTHKQGWQQLGHLLKLKHFNEAAHAFNQAVTLNSDDADSLYAGAMAYHKLGQVSQASEFLHKALDLRPDWRGKMLQNPLLKDYLAS